MTDQEYPTRYDASLSEQKWYAAWEKAGLFQPEENSTKEKFVITIPPPNITGSLHMGHALCYSIQDLVGRYHRLRGKNVLVLPGQDHAGIAASIRKISQSLGGLRTQQALAALEANDAELLTRMLLDYYDKLYRNSLGVKSAAQVYHLKFDRFDLDEITAALRAQATAIGVQW